MSLARIDPLRVTLAASAMLPHPRQLAALGTVLCLYRPQQGGELSGWAQAARVEAHAGVGSDGLRESLRFFDRDGRDCWRLCLLPDSDFLAWDELAARLPQHAPAEQREAGIGDRLWQRLARRLTGEQWRACALRLHALPQPFAPPALAASPAALSALGVAKAHEIAGAEAAELDLPPAGDCCCAQAPRRASAAIPAAAAIPPIRSTRETRR
jgi:hypothetical protein